MAFTMANYVTYEWQPGNWASSFYNYYYYIIIYKFNYILSCLRVRVYEKGLPGCQVATSERQVVFRVVVEDDAFLIGLHILRRALNDEIATDAVIMFIMLCFFKFILSAELIRNSDGIYLWESAICGRFIRWQRYKNDRNSRLNMIRRIL